MSEHPFFQICAAAQRVHVPDHDDRFRRAVGRQFGDQAISDGRKPAAFLTYWQPNSPAPSSVTGLVRSWKPIVSAP